MLDFIMVTFISQPPSVVLDFMKKNNGKYPKMNASVRVIIDLAAALCILISSCTSKIAAEAQPRANMADQGQEGGWNSRYGGGSSRDGSWEYRWGSGSGPGGAGWGFGAGSGRSGGGGPSGFGFGWGGSSSGEGGTGNFGFYGGNFGFGPFGGGGANFNGGFGFGGGGNPTGQPGGHGVGVMNNGNNPGNRASGSRS